MLEEVKLIEENDRALIIGEVGEAAHLGAIEKAIVGFMKRGQHNADFGAEAKRDGREKGLNHWMAHQPVIDLPQLFCVARHLENPSYRLYYDFGLSISPIGHPGRRNSPLCR